MQIKQGCIVENVKKGFILQQVNCKGVMNSGVAKVIREAYPAVYTTYKNRFGFRSIPLGEFQVIEVQPDLYVVNLFGQLTYGRTGQHTDYRALEQAIEDFSWSEIFLDLNSQLEVHHPKLGAGLGGGDWDKIKAIIEKNLGETTLWTLN